MPLTCEDAWECVEFGFQVHKKGFAYHVLILKA